ncbi:unnamed protein product [Rhizoctonia solani]|uniref:SF3A2 domain-containing protein n=1 Tax=Rhizoctonia solani TaxID=456999 RepID=A0A8H3AIM5_9AGAM|nr:unnamed protein product [Rhizoctonia solani]
MAGSTLLMAVYGYEVTSANDSLVKVVEDAVEGFSQAVIVSNYFVNTAPWLQYLPEWFPGAAWKAKANAWPHQKDLMLHVPYEWTKKQMAAGTAVPSMLSFWLTRYVYQKSSLGLAEMEDRVRWAAGTIFSAGTDTSVASTRVFIMAMAMHPEIQAKAQAEIDAVIGTRLPEMGDQETLSCVQRIVKEVFRWRMVLPLALPHACIQDDVYKDYHIPKGAIVIGNSWAISNDPAVYSDPDRFDPDRFLLGRHGLRACKPMPSSSTGPSVVREASLFIIAAGLLAMFNIRPDEDKDGNPIPLKPEMGLNEAVRTESAVNLEVVHTAHGDSVYTWLRLQTPLMRFAERVSQDPYILRNHLGSLECRLCLTLHTNEGSYLAHTVPFFVVWLNRAARRALRFHTQLITAPAPAASVPRKMFIKIGRPGYRVTKVRDPLMAAAAGGGGAKEGMMVQIHLPQIKEGVIPRRRFMSAWEQKNLVAAEPYESIAFRIPAREIEDLEENPDWNWSHWDADTKQYSFQFMFKTSSLAPYGQ